MPPLAPYRRALDYSYAPGLFPTLEALKKRPASVRRLLYASGAQDSEGLALARHLAGQLGVRCEQADRALARISGKENCHAAAVFDKWEEPLSRGRRHLVLHRPADRGNLGSILRSALGFHFTDVALIRPCADPFHPEVIRASMGALFSLRILEFPSMDAYLRTQPDRVLYPFMTGAALELDGKVPPPSGAYALVLGNEAEGLPPSFSELGHPVRIPHGGGIDSLNLSVAAAIGMFVFDRADGEKSPRP